MHVHFLFQLRVSFVCTPQESSQLSKAMVKHTLNYVHINKRLYKQGIAKIARFSQNLTPDIDWMSNAMDMLLPIAEINVCHLWNFRILHQSFRVQKFPLN